jgi:hypothetical protein
METDVNTPCNKNSSITTDKYTIISTIKELSLSVTKLKVKKREQHKARHGSTYLLLLKNYLGG